MQWRRQAIDLLDALRWIWEGEKEPAVVFADRGFVLAFMRIMEQYLKDLGYSAPEQELKNCLTLRRLTFITRHGHELTFTSQANEADWIAEAVALHTGKMELTKSDLVQMTTQLASYIEDIMKTCARLPSGYLRPIEDMVDGIERYLDP
jgi:hypothetical protein